MSFSHVLAQHRFLRTELLYSRKWVYYGIAVVDVLLRCTWVFTIAPESLGITLSPDLFLFCLSLGEVTRRFLWNFFRMENESATNCGNFRAVKDVPLPYDHDDDDDKGGSRPDQPSEADALFSSADPEEVRSMLTAHFDDDDPLGGLGENVGDETLVSRPDLRAPIPSRKRINDSVVRSGSHSRLDEHVSNSRSHSRLSSSSVSHELSPARSPRMSVASDRRDVVEYDYDTDTLTGDDDDALSQAAPVEVQLPFVEDTLAAVMSTATILEPVVSKHSAPMIAIHIEGPEDQDLPLKAASSSSSTSSSSSSDDTTSSDENDDISLRVVK